MEIISYYHQQDILRSSFNALAEETFGLNFENWYRLGYWGDQYTPYSILEDGQIVANVSVNRTDLVIWGERKRMYQLGTVMTKPEYRNRGYIRRIMASLEEILSDAVVSTCLPTTRFWNFIPNLASGKVRSMSTSARCSRRALAAWSRSLWTRRKTASGWKPPLHPEKL